MGEVGRGWSGVWGKTMVETTLPWCYNRYTTAATLHLAKVYTLYRLYSCYRLYRLYSCYSLYRVGCM